MPKNKILIPLNPSQLSQQILPYVEKFISADENDLIVFFITKPPSGIGFGKPDLGSGYQHMPGDKPVRQTLHPIYASQQQESIRAHVEAELMPATNRLKEASFNVTLLVDFGNDSTKEILSVIARDKINLVAMSTRARIGVTRFFFRDIADTVAQKARIPVLLIHPPEE